MNPFLVRHKETCQEWVVLANDTEHAISMLKFMIPGHYNPMDMISHPMQVDRAYVVNYGERTFIH